LQYVYAARVTRITAVKSNLELAVDIHDGLVAVSDRHFQRTHGVHARISGVLEEDLGHLGVPVLGGDEPTPAQHTVSEQEDSSQLIR
jgi:hypothetical protein